MEGPRCEKMGFPAAIREKSQREIALLCDAHSVPSGWDTIGQPCVQSFSESNLVRTFWIVQPLCAGNCTRHTQSRTYTLSLTHTILAVLSSQDTCKFEQSVEHTILLTCSQTFGRLWVSRMVTARCFCKMFSFLFSFSLVCLFSLSFSHF